MTMFSFPKQQRLLNPSDFKKVINFPTLKLMNEAFVMYVSVEAFHPIIKGLTRLGLAIAKKHVKKAVQRNTFKRIVRESFRLHAFKLPIDIVIMSRPRLQGKNKQELRQKIDELWISLQNKFPEPLASFV